MNRQYTIGIYHSYPITLYLSLRSFSDTKVVPWTQTHNWGWLQLPPLSNKSKQKHVSNYIHDCNFKDEIFYAFDICTEIVSTQVFQTILWIINFTAFIIATRIAYTLAIAVSLKRRSSITHGRYFSFKISRRVTIHWSLVYRQTQGRTNQEAISLLGVLRVSFSRVMQ